MRTLPRNIYDNGDSWLVRVMRSGVMFQAVVMKTFGGGASVPASRGSSAASPHLSPSLVEAIRRRDHFYAVNGKFPVRAAHSNTGHTGITDVTKWHHSRPYDCFQVTAGHPRRGMKRFFYRNAAERETALAAAIAHRAHAMALLNANL